MVGYVMVIYDYDVPEYDIWHMMIDASEQGRGCAVIPNNNRKNRFPMSFRGALHLSEAVGNYYADNVAFSDNKDRDD